MVGLHCKVKATITAAEYEPRSASFATRTRKLCVRRVLAATVAPSPTLTA